MKFFNISVRLRYLLTAGILLLTAVTSQAQMEDGVRIRERVMRYKMTRLVEVLDMDEPTAEKFFVRYNLSQNAIKAAQDNLDSTVDELEKAVQDNNRARIKELTDQSLKRHAELQETIAEMFRALRPLLSEDQYARFLIFEARFQEEIKRRLMELRDKPPEDNKPRRPRRGRD